MTHPLKRLEAVLIVGIGGFAGSSSRHLIETVIPSTLIGTALVNILGCLALGLVLYEELYDDAVSGPTRTILATGFIASFTTYSTFIRDAMTSSPRVAITYVLGSYALGFVAVLIGRSAARRLSDYGGSR